MLRNFEIPLFRMKKYVVDTTSFNVSCYVLPHQLDVYGTPEQCTGWLRDRSRPDRPQTFSSINGCIAGK